MANEKTFQKHLLSIASKLCVFLLVCCLIVACQSNQDNALGDIQTIDSLDQQRDVKPEIKRFKSVDGQFSIQFPGVPKTNVSSSPTEIGIVEVTQYIYSSDDKEVWIASFADYSNQMMQNGNISEMIDGIQAEVLTGLEASELQSRPFLFNDKYDGKTLTAFSEKNGIDILYNIILVDNRIYQLGMFSSIGPFSMADSIDFMSSFQLDL